MKYQINTEEVLTGKMALEYTNDFRKINRLPPLYWNDSIHWAALEHSQNMAEGLVPFSH